MALPSSYLTSYKNVPAILDSIKAAQAPERFTIKFLQDLGYTSAADRLIIKMLKTLGLLAESGEPTQRYHEFLDPSESGRVLAEALSNAYSDLFQIKRNAQVMSAQDVKAKFKTISQGDYSDAVLSKMANTFVELVKHADFEAITEQPKTSSEDKSPEDTSNEVPINKDTSLAPGSLERRPMRLVYEVNIQLPTTRDPAVYDALFSALSKHLDV